MKIVAKLGLLAVFLASACAGSAARSEALLPAMRQAWQGIRECVVRELAAAPDANGAAALVGADTALRLDDPVGLAAVDWRILDELASSDVARRLAAGQISQGVAESLAERLARFAEARATYTRSK